MPELDTISIIIPAFNEEKHIGSCIKALIAANKNNIGYEIIVMDNGSVDDTAEVAKNLGVTIKIRPDVNVATLRNIGASFASGDLLAFVDADCTVGTDWLLSVMKCFKRESADAVGSFHAIPKTSGWIGEISSAIQSHKIGSTVNYIPSGNMIIKKDIFLKVNGFNTSLETGEDVDICYRLKEKGYKIFNDPQIISTHYGSPATINEMFLREIWHGKTMLNIFLNEFPRNWRVVLFSFVFLINLVGIVLGVFAVFMFSSYSLLLLGILSIFSVNLFLTIKDWLKFKCNFLKLFFFIMIYGTARAFSLLNSFFNNQRFSSKTIFL